MPYLSCLMGVGVVPVGLPICIFCSPRILAG